MLKYFIEERVRKKNCDRSREEGGRRRARRACVRRPGAVWKMPRAFLIVELEVHDYCLWLGIGELAYITGAGCSQTRDQIKSGPLSSVKINRRTLHNMLSESEAVDQNSNFTFVYKTQLII